MARLAPMIEVIPALRVVMAGPAAGRVGVPARERAGVPAPAIPLDAARPRHNDRDHRDAPLRGGPVVTKARAASAVIYGEAGNGKRQTINKLLIDDRWASMGAA